MLIPLFAFVIAPLLYPIAYLLRNGSLYRKKPLWWFFDDEDGLYGAPYWREQKGITKRNFWVSYKWCAIRNPMWNLQASLVPKDGAEVFVSGKGNLSISGQPLEPTWVAVLHYVDENGDWTHNVGKYLSLKYSIIGKTFIWFKIGGRLYWRGSLASKLYKNLWVELQVGVNSRYIFKFKLKKVKIYEDYIK